MSKQVTKWIKRIGIIIISIIVLFCTIPIYNWVYNDYYLPYKYNSLYAKGLYNENIVDSVAIVLMNFNGWQQEEYENKAIKLLTKSAEKGNIKSQVLLGRYYKGYPAETGYADTWSSYPSKEKAEKSSYWYLQAAKKGDAEAQGEIGHNYKYGIGVKQNLNKALYWIKKGADNGNAIAQWRMGILYRDGIAFYNIDFLHKEYWYNGDNLFRSLDNEKYEVKDSYLQEILENPYNVILKPNLKKAKYYWKLSAKQGFQKAKDELEKVYD